jgi:DNA mismatch repair protein MutS2
VPFLPGDLVHVAILGKGVVREVRNGDRYLVEVKGRSLVARGDQLTPQDAPRKGTTKVATVRRPPPDYEGGESRAVSIDLHGSTVDEALDAVIRLLDGAMMSGASEVRVIHGRSGGKIKAALHKQLRALPSVRGFSIDPRNAGVTIIRL